MVQQQSPVALLFIQPPSTRAALLPDEGLLIYFGGPYHNAEAVGALDPGRAVVVWQLVVAGRCCIASWRQDYRLIVQNLSVYSLPKEIS